MFRISHALACCSVFCLASVWGVQAQERAAATTLETQMTWSTLSNLVEAANANSKAANMRIDQSILCNKKFMAYAPGAPGADGDGCIENELIKQLANRMDKAEKDIIDTNDKLAALESKVDSEIKRIDTSISDLVARVNGLNTRLTSVEAGMKVLNERMTSVEALVNALKARVTSLESTVSLHTSQIAEINRQIAAINAKLTAMQKEIDALEVKVNDHATKIARMIDCGKKGQVYNGTTCIGAQSSSSSGISCTRQTESQDCGGKDKSKTKSKSCASGYVAVSGGYTQLVNEYNFAYPLSSTQWSFTCGGANKTNFLVCCTVN